MSEPLPVAAPESERRLELQVCPVSLEAARQITAPLLEQIIAPDSVLYAVANDRAARMEPGSQLALAPILHVDPSRSGATAARYMLQEGRLPRETPTSPEQAVILWMVAKKDIPSLRVPEGKDTSVMALADSMQMRGGGPVIFERSEVREMEVSEDEIVLISAGAMRANIERVQTALEVAKHHELNRPIIAATDPTRVLRQAELERVAGFAPGARNEHQLFIASARENGFVLDETPYGVSSLPDGSYYQAMTHAETGQTMIVLAPAKRPQATGLSNAYTTLSRHGAEIFGQDDFMLDGSRVTYVTSTHYGAMGVMNNLAAATQQRLQLGGFQVVGDNQPKTRGAQAHLVEIGLTLNALEGQTTRYPGVRAALLN